MSFVGQFHSVASLGRLTAAKHSMLLDKDTEKKGTPFQGQMIMCACSKGSATRGLYL